MARIRTVKPALFRHELLQDLEAANPGRHLMLVFIALFGHCDKEGAFPWTPRMLSLDILPFLDFDLNASLVLLWEAGQIERYEIDGKQYGFIPTFKEHQRFTGKESQEPAKYPLHNENFTARSQENSGEAPGKRPGALEGKGKEEEGKGKGKGKIPPSEGAFAPSASTEKELFDFGKQVLGANAGGLIKRLKDHAGINGAMAHLREAEGKSTPREWIGAILVDPEARADRDHEAWQEAYYRGVQ